MSIIVDTNSTHLMFNGDAAGVFVYEQIVSGKIIYVTGGKHRDEILNGGMPKKIFRQLQLAGKIRVYSDAECVECENNIISKLEILSDDPHVLALAVRSGCRVLFSFDVDLCKDFKNKTIIDNPRGKVFQTPRHKQLLKKSSESLK